MIGRWVARPLAGKTAATALIVSVPAAMMVMAGGPAGPASAAVRHRPAAQHESAKQHRSAKQHKSAAQQRQARHRRADATVTLRTLVSRIRVRSEPATTAKVTGTIKRSGTRVTISCYSRGDRVAGNPVWYQLARPVKGFVTSYYIDSHYDPVSGVTRCAAVRHRQARVAKPTFRRMYRTLVKGVHIRYWPTTTATRLATLGRVGSTVTVNCYARGQKISGDVIWYHVTRPLAGFVAGLNLNTGEDPAYGIPACW
jgi:hypothetical protein